MLTLLMYTLTCWVLVYFYERRKAQTAERFLVADRRIDGLTGALSIAASWIWAPALFVSTQIGFKWGFSGLLWFTLPNMLTLMVFGIFASKIRQLLPNGYSYIEMLRPMNRSFYRTQLGVQLLFQALCYAIQLNGGATLLSFVTGIDYAWIVLIMAFGPLIYSLRSGLSASVFTDWIQYIFIAIPIGLIFLNLQDTVSLGSLSNASFEPFDPKVLMETGLATLMTLIFGIFSDHQQWQRGFSTNPKTIIPMFVSAGFLHGAVTASLGTLGVLLALSGFQPENVQIVGAEFISQSMAPVFLILFIIMALCGLGSTLDSALCAFSSLWATEIEPDKPVLETSRKSMLILTLCGVIIALSGISLLTLWFATGLLRIAAALPTMFSLVNPRFAASMAGTIAIISGIAIGGPFFLAGALLDIAGWRLIGMVICLTTSTICCLMAPVAHEIIVRWRKAAF